MRQRNGDLHKHLQDNADTCASSPARALLHVSQCHDNGRRSSSSNRAPQPCSQACFNHTSSSHRAAVDLSTGRVTTSATVNGHVRADRGPVGRVTSCRQWATERAGGRHVVVNWRPHRHAATDRQMCHCSVCRRVSWMSTINVGDRRRPCTRSDIIVNVCGS